MSVTCKRNVSSDALNLTLQLYMNDGGGGACNGSYPQGCHEFKPPLPPGFVKTTYSLVSGCANNFIVDNTLGNKAGSALTFAFAWANASDFSSKATTTFFWVCIVNQAPVANTVYTQTWDTTTIVSSSPITPFDPPPSTDYINGVSTCAINTQPGDIVINYVSLVGPTGGPFATSLALTCNTQYTAAVTPTSGTIAGVAYTVALAPALGTGGAQDTIKITATTATGQAGSCAGSCSGNKFHTVTITY